MDWKAAAGILVLPIIAIGIWYAYKSYQPAPLPETAFSETGNLTRNNPGQVPDTWYLVYEKPGAPGLSTALVFDHSSRCGSESMLDICDISFEQGERVHIEGVQQGEFVTVRTLIYLPAVAPTVRTIQLYYYNPALDQGPGGVQCSSAGLVALERVIPHTTTPIQDAVKLLLRGEISDEERAQGITSEFPLPEVTLQSASLSNGVLTLTFSDPRNQTIGGSCRVGVLWHQIEATAKQFPEVTSVRFMPEDLFQP